MTGLKNRLRKRLGGAHTPIPRLYRRLRPRWIWLRFHSRGRLTARYIAENGLVVEAGPFAGMRYPRRAVARAGYLTAKLAGSYEREIYSALTEADLFVAVGSGDGFYCVGYARTFPDAAVVGYETDRGQRRIAAELAAINGVDVKLNGTCGPADLNTLPTDVRVLLLIDVEGHERELLDPARVPGLARASMIVEVHLDADPRMVEILDGRFNATHEIEVRREQQRDLGEVAALAGWNDEDRQAALTEDRLDGVWLILTPRDSYRGPSGTVRFT